MAIGASASDGTGVSGSLSVSARLFPSRLFGYTFFGQCKKVFGRCCWTGFLQILGELFKKTGVTGLS
jgi:hypothetical protein